MLRHNLCLAACLKSVAAKTSPITKDEGKLLVHLSCNFCPVCVFSGQTLMALIVAMIRLFIVFLGCVLVNFIHSFSAVDLNRIKCNIGPEFAHYC